MFAVLLLLLLGCHQALAGTVGCTYNGALYRTGNKIMVGCDECRCGEGGVLDCPPEYPSCPRNCTFHGQHFKDKDEWLDVCSKCHCKDGTTICMNNICEDTCKIDGRVYNKGDKFKRDCNDCVCAGNDELECTKKKCYCLDREGKFVDNGESYQDENCNSCWCVNGEAKCTTGSTCFASCFIDGRVVKHAVQLAVQCLVFGCEDGTPYLVANNCYELQKQMEAA